MTVERKVAHNYRNEKNPDCKQVPLAKEWGATKQTKKKKVTCPRKDSGVYDTRRRPSLLAKNKKKKKQKKTKKKKRNQRNKGKKKGHINDSGGPIARGGRGDYWVWGGPRAGSAGRRRGGIEGGG